MSFRAVLYICLRLLFVLLANVSVELVDYLVIFMSWITRLKRLKSP